LVGVGKFFETKHQLDDCVKGIQKRQTQIADTINLFNKANNYER
jgi:hypothetical protein